MSKDARVLTGILASLLHSPFLMTKLVVINLGSGDLLNGFPQVTVQMWAIGSSFSEQVVGSLPPAPGLFELYQYWQSIYRCLCDRQSLRSSALIEKDLAEEDTPLEIDEAGITNVSQANFEQVCAQFCLDLNAWLTSRGFLRIERQMRSQLNTTEELQVIIETNNEQVRQLPWHCWDFFQDYPKAEMALSRLEYKRRKLSPTRTAREKVRILAILGNSTGIDLESESRFLRGLPDAETEFLVNPSRRDFNQQLWDERGWDILFFAGHSQSEGQTGRIYINEKPGNNSLTIEQLEESLNAAIDNGLKLAIFNSCDGLGLANALGKLHIPGIIVMREPVPNLVAQEFFRHFLTAFGSQRLPLYLAVRQARRRLQGVEDDFPGASWLPVLCQNPAAETMRWQDWCDSPNPIAATQPDRPPRSRLTARYLGIVLLSSAIVSTVVIGARYLGGLQPWELQAFDQLTRLRPEEPQDDRLLIVAVTENDFQLPEQEQRQGSLSDLALAKLLAKLMPLKPRAIGLDIYHDFPLSPNQPGLASYLRNDNFFAICKASDSNNDRNGGRGILPLPGIPKERQGLSDVVTDPDGILRRQLLAIKPSPASLCATSYTLSAQLALHYLVAERVAVQYTAQGDLQMGQVVLQRLKNHRGAYQKIDAGGYQIGLNYRRTQSDIAQIVTLQDVLAGRINPEDVKDRIILIGVTAPSVNDYFATPYGTERMPGVVLQAQMVSQLISAVKDGRSLLEPWQPWEEALWILGWAIVGGALAWRYRSPMTLLLMTGIAIGVLYGLCAYLLVQGKWVPLVPAVLALTVTGSSVVVCSRLLEKGGDRNDLL